MVFSSMCTLIKTRPGDGYIEIPALAIAGSVGFFRASHAIGSRKSDGLFFPFLVYGLTAVVALLARDLFAQLVDIKLTLGGIQQGGKNHGVVAVSVFETAQQRGENMFDILEPFPRMAVALGCQKLKKQGDVIGQFIAV